MRFLLLLLIFISQISLAQDPNHITGGFEIDISETPYQVSIEYDNEHLCGGSIINGGFILTAAHCLFFKDGSRRDVSSFRVKVGMTDLDGSFSGRYNIVSATEHPNYTHGSFDFDFALLEINGTIRFNSLVQPVELISDATAHTQNIENTVRVSGWGWTTPGMIPSPSNELMAVDVPIISNAQADGQLDISNPSHQDLTNRMLATSAISNNRLGACHGDSGGPLVFRQNGVPDIQIGIVSWGIGGCLGGVNSPTIYSRILSVAEWIELNSIHLVVDGSSTVCPTDTSFTLSGVPTGQTVSWSVSSNLQLVSSNATGATVRAVSSSTSGSATLTATLSNGVEVAQVVWVGRPEIFNSFIVSTRAYHPLGGVWYNARLINSAYTDSVEWMVNKPAYISGSGDSVLIRPLYNPSWIMVSARPSNSCGTADWVTHIINLSPLPGESDDSEIFEKKYF